MAVVKRHELLGHFSGRQTPPRSVLIHGADRGAVTELCNSIVKQVTGGNDALSVVRLSEAQVTSSEARLYSEFAARSMFGDKLVVWVSDAGDSVVKALESILASDEDGNLILIESENLPKFSKLRKLCESDRRSLALALYEESAHELRQRLELQMRRAGVTASDEAMERLMLVVSRERSIGESEVNKLLTYVHGRSQVAFEDVVAVCGDTLDADADELFDSVFEGDMEAADRQLMTLQSQGSLARGMLPMALAHVARLQAMSIQLQQGQSLSEVVSAPRNNVFFKRRNSISQQLQLWSLESLLDAEERIAEAILAGRRTADLEDTFASRTLLALSWQARSQAA